MGIIIDIIIVLFILASIFLGYKKGLITLGIQLCAFLIAIVVTFVFYRPIGNIMINTTQIDEKLQETIQANVEKFMAEDHETQKTNSLIESARNGMLQETARNLAINIIYGITMLVLFAILRIGLLFINSLANAIAKLPILDQFNKLGGILYGLLRGVLISYVILMIISLMISVNPKSSLSEMMDTTYLAKTMSTYNVLNLFFK